MPTLPARPLRRGRSTRALVPIAIALLAGCTSGKPVAMSPVDTTQVFKVSERPSEVYLRIYDRMNTCHAVHNIFDPGDIVGGMDPDGEHGRIYFANNGQALWGAELGPTEGGTRVITHVGKDASSDRFHELLRSWAEGRRTPALATAEC